MPLQSFWQDFFCYFFVKCTHIQQENKIIGYVQSLISKSGPISLKMRNLSRYSLLKNDDSYSCQYFSTAYSSDKKKSTKLTQYILFSLSFSTYLHTISTYYLSMYLHSLFRYLLTAVACCIKSFKTLFWREKFWRINFKNMHAWITRYFDEKMLNHVWFCVYIFWTENLTLKTYHILTKKNVESCLLKKNLHEFLFCSNFN